MAPALIGETMTDMQKSPLEHVRARQREIHAEIEKLGSFDKMTSAQQGRYEQLDVEMVSMMDREQELEERASRAQAAASVNWSTRTPGGSSGDEFRDAALRNIESSHLLSDESKHSATLVADAARLDPTATGVSRYMAVASDPVYARAFAQYLRYPQDAPMRMSRDEHAAFVRTNDEYRAMTAGTGSTGGYMVPLYMDPSFLITGAGALNPFRQVAKIKQITTLTYNGSTAAQVSAGLLTENGAFTDVAPTVSQVQIGTYKIGAYIPASFEAFEDIDALAADVAELFADAKLNYEATQFATGTGSAPHGVVADVGAVTASRVSPATGGAYAVADVYSVHGGLSPRYRNSPSSSRAWMMSVNTIDKTRQFATANNYHAFLTDLGGGQPSQLVGDQLFEASAMSSSYTTGQDVVLYGDFSRYYIVDRLDSMVEFVPNVFNSSGLPTGTRAWLFHWRVGAAVADTAAFRLLRL
jgi:HK97 family phage major capsid protein